MGIGLLELKGFFNFTLLLDLLVQLQLFPTLEWNELPIQPTALIGIFPKKEPIGLVCCNLQGDTSRL